jgi:N-ethylmaleimide reductase
VRDSINTRNDDYGVSIANRLRFPLAVARAVTAVWDPKRVATGQTMPRKRGARLDELGLGYIHMIEGNTQGTCEYPGTIDLNVLRRRFGGATSPITGSRRSERSKRFGRNAWIW